MNETVKQYIFLFIAVGLMAISVNTVIIPYNIIAGGVSGLSAIVEFLTPLSSASFVFLANLILIIAAFIFISPRYALNSILGANILFPLALTIVPVGALSDDILLSSIFGGALTGLGIYFLSKSNGSTGGTAITGKIIQKYSGFSYATSVVMCDAMIIIAGLFIFGIENTMYAAVFLIISSLSANYFEQGAKKTTVFHIITTNDDEMKTAIIEQIGRGVTIVKAEGGYRADNKTILICVAKNSDIMRLKKLINNIDEHSFYYLTSASSTYGEGFSLLENGIH